MLLAQYEQTCNRVDISPPVVFRYLRRSCDPRLLAPANTQSQSCKLGQSLAAAKNLGNVFRRPPRRQENVEAKDLMDIHAIAWSLMEQRDGLA